MQRCLSLGFILVLGSGMLVGAQDRPHAKDKEAGFRVSFCPRDSLWTYPLDEIHGVRGLLLQSVLLMNRGPELRVTSVEIELLDRGTVRDKRQLTSQDVADVGAAAPQITAFVRLVPGQFCGLSLVQDQNRIAGPVLPKNSAMLLLQEPFAYTGRRDALRVTAHALFNGRAVASRGTIPIAGSRPAGRFVFPLRGAWYVANGPTFHTGHRWFVTEEFALDLVKIDSGGASHAGPGTRFEDYYDYGAAVSAMADGRVVDVSQDANEDLTAMRRPGETSEAYAARLAREQDARIQGGKSGLLGNYVVIDHGRGEYAVYAHLRPGKAIVHVGEDVTAGQTIGTLGSSGNSTEPHLHVQLCDRPDPTMCAGIPMQFIDVTLPQADGPRMLQTGDLVVTH